MAGSTITRIPQVQSGEMGIGIGLNAKLKGAVMFAFLFVRCHCILE